MNPAMVDTVEQTVSSQQTLGSLSKSPFTVKEPVLYTPKNENRSLLLPYFMNGGLLFYTRYTVRQYKAGFS